MKERDSIFRSWKPIFLPEHQFSFSKSCFLFFALENRLPALHLLGSIVAAFFGGFLLFCYLFNCSSSRWIGRNQAAGKSFTLYLPVILDSGPICRSKLLFCIILCHRTHPFSLEINPEIMYHPALPDAPPEIKSSSFSVSVKNRRYRILTSVFRVPLGFFFFPSEYL